MFGNFLDTTTNSSNVIVPSFRLSHWAMIVSALRVTSASVLAI